MAGSRPRHARPWRISTRHSARTGRCFDDVFKCTVMLADMSKWADFNRIYVLSFKRTDFPHVRLSALPGWRWGRRSSLNAGPMRQKGNYILSGVFC